MISFASLPTHVLGLYGERICRLVLRVKGYRILARNWRCPQGELDIVAIHHHTLIFVEVKTRRTQNQDLDIITHRQKYRILAASRAFLLRFPHLRSIPHRFDVMILKAPFRLHHIPHVWQETMTSFQRRSHSL